MYDGMQAQDADRLQRARDCIDYRYREQYGLAMDHSLRKAAEDLQANQDFTQGQEKPTKTEINQIIRSFQFAVINALPLSHVQSTLEEAESYALSTSIDETHFQEKFFFSSDQCMRSSVLNIRFHAIAKRLIEAIFYQYQHAIESGINEAVEEVRKQSGSDIAHSIKVMMASVDKKCSLLRLDPIQLAKIANETDVENHANRTYSQRESVSERLDVAEFSPTENACNSDTNQPTQSIPSSNEETKNMHLTLMKDKLPADPSNMDDEKPEHIQMSSTEKMRSSSVVGGGDSDHEEEDELKEEDDDDDDDEDDDEPLCNIAARRKDLRSESESNRGVSSLFDHLEISSPEPDLKSNKVIVVEPERNLKRKSDQMAVKPENDIVDLTKDDESENDSCTFTRFKKAKVDDGAALQKNSKGSASSKVAGFNPKSKTFRRKDSIKIFRPKPRPTSQVVSKKASQAGQKSVSEEPIRAPEVKLKQLAVIPKVTSKESELKLEEIIENGLSLLQTISKQARAQESLKTILQSSYVKEFVKLFIEGLTEEGKKLIHLTTNGQVNKTTSFDLREPTPEDDSMYSTSVMLLIFKRGSDQAKRNIVHPGSIKHAAYVFTSIRSPKEATKTVKQSRNDTKELYLHSSAGFGALADEIFSIPLWRRKKDWGSAYAARMQKEYPNAFKISNVKDSFTQAVKCLMITLCWTIQNDEKFNNDIRNHFWAASPLFKGLNYKLPIKETYESNRR